MQVKSIHKDVEDGGQHTFCKNLGALFISQLFKENLNKKEIFK